MTGSVVLNTALGLVFIFLAASLACTGLLEYLSKILNKRGDYLLRGLREMLDIPPATPGAPGTEPAAAAKTLGLLGSGQTRQQLNSLATEGANLPEELRTSEKSSYQPASPLADLVLAHPLVAALHRPARPGRAVGTIISRRRPIAARRDEMHLASYLSAETFATALIDLLVADETGKTSAQRLHESIEKLDEKVPARAALLALLRDTQGDLERFRAALERWYDEQMARVSGWYKRWAQWRLFVIGTLLATVINIDSLNVAQTLYRDEPVRAAVVAQALASEGCPAEAGTEREQCLARQRTILLELPLPIGWELSKATTECTAYNQGQSCLRRPWLVAPFITNALRETGLGGILLTLIGWLMTAAAVSFGAPFWFDTLNRLGSLRTGGRHVTGR